KATIKRVIYGILFIFTIWTVFNAINPEFLKSGLNFKAYTLTQSDGDANASNESEKHAGQQTTQATSSSVTYCAEGLETIQGSYQMCKSVAGKMKQMISDAAGEGVTLIVVSAYREAASCTLTTGTCAKGVSNHQKGLAVDFSGFKTGPASDSRYVWLKNNASKYGFYNQLVDLGKRDEYNHWSTTGR
ncbi:MAG: VanY protein, partial [Patescibacteria group bacterium]|nr:VanY protein [Patescibacteria group bacterium]